jgi:hypothetical protein
MDIVTFLGPRVPLEVKKVFPLLAKIPNNNAIKIIALTVEYLKGAEITEQHFETFANSVQLDKQTLSTAFIGFYCILSNCSTVPVDSIEIVPRIEELSDRLIYPHQI